MTRKRLWLAAAFTIAITLGIYGLTSASGPRSVNEFDAGRVADLELRMWQAYYAKEKVRLFALLVTMLREQYHYSWATAVDEGFHLARAAAVFGDAKPNYEQVLPDLEKGYGVAKDWLEASYDPAQVARAELAWWVARRIPGQNSAEHVGELMADDYALFYGMPPSRMLHPALLRAQAGALRDAEASDPDWTTIGALLKQSYRELHEALAAPTN
jgi:hypothetical protein